MDRQKLIDAGIDYDSGVERLMGNTEMYERFLQMFLDDDSFKNLDAAMQSQNYQEAFLQAHTLKGVLAILVWRNYTRIWCCLWICCAMAQTFQGQ